MTVTIAPLLLVTVLDVENENLLLTLEVFFLIGFMAYLVCIGQWAYNMGRSRLSWIVGSLILWPFTYIATFFVKPIERRAKW